MHDYNALSWVDIQCPVYYVDSCYKSFT